MRGPIPIVKAWASYAVRLLLGLPSIVRRQVISTTTNVGMTRSHQPLVWTS